MMNPAIIKALMPLLGFLFTGGFNKIGRQFNSDPNDNPSPMEWGQTGLASTFPLAAGRLLSTPQALGGLGRMDAFLGAQAPRFAPAFNSVLSNPTMQAFRGGPIGNFANTVGPVMGTGVLHGSPSVLNSIPAFQSAVPNVSNFINKYPLTSNAVGGAIGLIGEANALFNTPPDYNPPPGNMPAPVSPYLQQPPNSVPLEAIPSKTRAKRQTQNNGPDFNSLPPELQKMIIMQLMQQQQQQGQPGY